MSIFLAPRAGRHRPVHADSAVINDGRIRVEAAWCIASTGAKPNSPNQMTFCPASLDKWVRGRSQGCSTSLYSADGVVRRLSGCLRPPSDSYSINLGYHLLHFGEIENEEVSASRGRLCQPPQKRHQVVRSQPSPR